MNISFEKTDRLIALIEDSYLVICGKFFEGASKLKLSEEHQKRTLYDNLVRITDSNMTEYEKNNERIKCFAKLWGEENNIELGKKAMRATFDEKVTMIFLSKAYWQIETFTRVKRREKFDFSNVDDIRGIIEKYYPNEPCKDVLMKVIMNKEPTIDDIEKEFWNNCTSSDVINDFCNIYLTRWNEHLKKIDRQYYDVRSLHYDDNNKLGQSIRDLRLCGLLQGDENAIECRINGISKRIELVCNGVINIITKMRSSTQLPLQMTSNICLSKQKGKKVNIIRVINCLHELDFFKDEKGNDIAKQKVMEAFGTLLNQDFSTFSNDLSSTKSASNKDGNSLTKIFHEMLSKQKEINGIDQ